MVHLFCMGVCSRLVGGSVKRGFMEDVVTEPPCDMLLIFGVDDSGGKEPIKSCRQRGVKLLFLFPLKPACHGQAPLIQHPILLLCTAVRCHSATALMDNLDTKSLPKLTQNLSAALLLFAIQAISRRIVVIQIWR